MSNEANLSASTWHRKVAVLEARIQELEVTLYAVAGNLGYLASPDHFGKQAAYERLEQIVSDAL